MSPRAPSVPRTLAAVVSLAALTLGACADPAPHLDDRPELADHETGEPLPTTREAFLHELAPAPSDALQISYEVSGPAGLGGSLEIVLRPGGRRVERWRLSLPLPDGEARTIEGRAVQTEDYVWTGEGESLVVDRAPLGVLADAYMTLSIQEQRRVVEGLRAFRAQLEVAREDDQATMREILGVPCLETQLAAQSLCLWEETGLPLTYDGNVFSLRALAIDLDPQVDDWWFEVPPEVEHNAPGPDLDPDASLQRLARRDYAELGPLLHPGLRLPLGV